MASCGLNDKERVPVCRKTDMPEQGRTSGPPLDDGNRDVNPQCRHCDDCGLTLGQGFKFMPGLVEPGSCLVVLEFKRLKMFVAGNENQIDGSFIPLQL